MTPTLAATAASELIRAQFPSLASGFAFFENAGGSQIPRQAIEAATRLMTEAYVQFGCGYAASAKVTQVMESSHELANRMFGGEGIGQTVLGLSTTSLMHMLAGCHRTAIRPGDEIVISVANHEANIGAWTHLEREGAVIRWWSVDPETGLSSLDGLRAVLSERTKLVCFPVTSNLLGDTMPVRGACDLAHSVGARAVVDAVAYASHAPMDVAAWDADFCAFSAYKVYGPHMAALFGKSEAWAELQGPNHFFIPNDEVPRKFELGCLPYEGCAAMLGSGQYFKLLAGGQAGDILDLPTRAEIVEAFGLMKRIETPVMVELLSFLASRSDIRILGAAAPGPERHPTISFLPHSKDPRDVVSLVHQGQFGIRSGHMYSLRLCEAMNIPPVPGVVRVSGVHTNTVDEARRLCAALDSAL